MLDCIEYPGNKTNGHRPITPYWWAAGIPRFVYCQRYGVLPDSELQLMMLSQLVLKTVYEIIVLPITIRVVKWGKRIEGEDVYDHNVNYNIFAVFRRTDD
jgi:hypothetical protein